MIVISCGSGTLTDAGAAPDSSSTVTNIPIHKQDLLTDGGDWLPPPRAPCVCVHFMVCVREKGGEGRLEKRWGGSDGEKLLHCRVGDAEGFRADA